MSMPEMTQLEAAMALLLTTFDQYAGKEGNKDTLNKAEVKTMMNEQLPGFLGVGPRPSSLHSGGGGGGGGFGRRSSKTAALHYKQCIIVLFLRCFFKCVYSDVDTGFFVNTYINVSRKRKRERNKRGGGNKTVGCLYNQRQKAK